jgi:hypothetical protein
MTPTLAGRWQTRGLLLATVGGLITAMFGLLFGTFGTPFALLGYVLALGLGWDALYNVGQSFRWDRDWPPFLQLAAGIVEGALIWGLLRAVGLPGVAENLTFGRFLAHYGSVWLGTFLFAQGPMRLLFPRWRFRGGQWL